MAIDWNAFFANGGFSNENSDPASYSDDDDFDESYYEDEYEEGMFDDDFYSQFLLVNLLENIYWIRIQ